jgi:hypothetical protein
LPLASFVLIVFFGPRMGKAGCKAGYLATGAISGSCLLSIFSLFCVWLPHYDLPAPAQHETGAEVAAHDTHAAHAVEPSVRPITGDWYTLGKFGSLRITIGYYID